MKRLIIVIILFTSISCNNSNKNHPVENNGCNSQIDSIHVLYYNYLFKPFKGIKCENITQSYIPDFITRDEGILDAVIKDCSVLHEIERELIKLKPLYGDSYEDIRIAATIYYKDKSKKSLCIGDWLTPLLFFNGEPQEMNGRLVYLIKNNIGYYPWFGEFILQRMKELNDSTVFKEPIQQSLYYKKYLENGGE